jgi:plasmid stability protein
MPYCADPRKEPAMPVNLSVRNVPDEIADKLRARAERNHRSLQGEMLSLLSEAAGEGGFGDQGREFTGVKSGQNRKLSLDEVVAEIRKLGLPRPAKNESTQMIREDRDNR